MENKEKQPIIFGYFYNNTLLGWRSDSFGTFSMEFPKIYHYSESQVKVVLDNVKSEMNGSTTRFFERLIDLNLPISDVQGNQYNGEDILELVRKREKEKFQYKDFELRIYPFLPYGDNWEYPEKWQIQAKLNNLDEPLEIHKFTTIENQN